MSGLSSYYARSRRGPTPAASSDLPSLEGTYGRWSAAESPGGGLKANGDWLSVDGSREFLLNGPPFSYLPTGLNGQPCLGTEGSSSFYIPSISFPNVSVATIMVLRTISTSVQVINEFSPNINGYQNTFGNFIESNKVEAYSDIGGDKHLLQIDQPPLSAALLVASRFYSNPRDTDFAVNDVHPAPKYTAAPTDRNMWETFPYFLFSRNNSQFFGQGFLAAFHLFDMAPDDADWAAWINHYKLLYQLS